MNRIEKIYKNLFAGLLISGAATRRLFGLIFAYRVPWACTHGYKHASAMRSVFAPRSRGLSPTGRAGCKQEKESALNRVQYFYKNALLIVQY